jgi:hypothetical protein
MTRCEVTDGILRIEILGWDKLWAFKDRIEVPLEQIVSVQRWEPGRRRFSHGLRAPGTNLPGVITAGTYHQREDGEWRHNFFDVHNFERAIVIELSGNWYHHIVVEVEDVDSALRLLTPQPETAPV